MREGEVTVGGVDMCLALNRTRTGGSSDIDDWEFVAGISDRQVDESGIESSGRFYCIRKDDGPVKNKRVPKKEWLNPWD